MWCGPLSLHCSNETAERNAQIVGNGFFGPSGGFGVPNFGNGWENYGGGYGAGYGGPSGGYAKGGTIRPTVVCKEKGPATRRS